MANRSDIQRPTKKELVKHIKDGESVKEMAEYFGVSTQTVRNWAEKFGVYEEMNSRTPIYRACRGKIKKVLKEMLKEGKSTQEISKELHVTQKAALDSIREYGLMPEYEKIKFKNRSNRRSKERAEKTEWWIETLKKMLIEEGKTVNQAKDELGVTKRTIYLRMREDKELAKMIRPHNMPSRAEIAERKERIRKMYHDGMKVADIARAENMQYANTLRVIKQIEEEEGTGK